MNDTQSTADPRRPSDALVSVVLPVYNELDAIQPLVDGIAKAFSHESHAYEIVFVNDGSQDGSEQRLDELAHANPSVRVVHFSRNFGHQAAVQAGLLNAKGQAVVLMDSDLQDDPQAIPRFLKKWRSGFDVVYAVRKKRKEGLLKRALFFGFYRFLNAITINGMPIDAGNFSLIDRQVADQIISLDERDRFFPGLRHWVGFSQIGINVERLARHDEQPRVTTTQLFGLAKTAIFGFSRAPLNCFYAVALLSLLVFVGCFCFTLYHKLVTDLAIPGWTSITMIASLFGTLNSLGICVLGEYVIRIHDQVRARPTFVVQRQTNATTNDRLPGPFNEDSYPTNSSTDPSTLERELHREVASLSQTLHSEEQLSLTEVTGTKG